VKDLKPWQQIDLVYHIEGGSADMLEDRSPGLGLFKLSQVDQSDLLAAMTGWAVFSLDPEVLAAAVRQKVKKCQKYGFRRAWPDAIVGKLENPSDSGPVSMQKNGLDIRFRDLGDNVPPMDDCRWQVDAWDGHGRCYPVGLAWLTDGAEEEIGRAYLLAILVWDPCRGQGVATAIIEACKERWPDLHLSRPISRAGYGLYLKTAPEFPPDECISWEKIESYLVHGLSREEVKKIARKDHLDSIKSFFDECEEDEDEDQNEEDEDQDEEDEEM
jgi:GNAT superfamily N-acetyltransferase